MDAHVSNVVREVTSASDEERVTFAEVVGALREAGVERYHADFVCSSKVYYMPDGKFEAVPCHPAGRIGREFSARGVEAAVRAIQAQEIKYREFCARIAAAGCVGYIVSLAGKRAVYYGRTGDAHTEWFAGARQV